MIFQNFEKGELCLNHYCLYFNICIINIGPARNRDLIYKHLACDQILSQNFKRVYCQVNVRFLYLRSLFQIGGLLTFLMRLVVELFFLLQINFQNFERAQQQRIAEQTSIADKFSELTADNSVCSSVISLATTMVARSFGVADAANFPNVKPTYTNIGIGGYGANAFANMNDSTQSVFSSSALSISTANLLSSTALSPGKNQAQHQLHLQQMGFSGDTSTLPRFKPKNSVQTTSSRALNSNAHMNPFLDFEFSVKKPAAFGAHQPHQGSLPQLNAVRGFSSFQKTSFKETGIMRLLLLF